MEPQWFTPSQHPHAPASTFSSRMAPKHLPDEAWQLTEQPWLCATGHHWKSHSPWWKQGRCPNCSCNYKKKKIKKCYCLPCKDCLPAKLLRHPYSVPYSPAQSPEAKLTAQILGGTSGSFVSPAVMHLFCKVRLAEEQAKLLPAQVRVATITIIPWEQGGPFCMAVPPRNRRLWRSVT